MLRQLLAHPLTRDLSIDSPETTELRREIIRTKPFLRQIYSDWCDAITQQIPDGPGEVLELGSGAGILSDHIPNLITSEVFPCTGINYGNQQGDYEGLVSFNGVSHPVWTDSRAQLSKIGSCRTGLAMEEVFTATVGKK